MTAERASAIRTMRRTARLRRGHADRLRRSDRALTRSARSSTACCTDGRCRANATKRSCIITKRSAGARRYNELTMRQAAALRERLARDGIDAPGRGRDAQYAAVLDDALARTGARRRAARARLHSRGASMRSELGALPARRRAARERVGAGGAGSRLPRRWHDASAVYRGRGRSRRATRSRGLAGRSDRDAQTDLHRAQYPGRDGGALALCRATAANRRDWSRGAVGTIELALAFQSRSGSPREPWLEPDINDVVRGLERTGGGGGADRLPLRPRRGALRPRYRGGARSRARPE